MADPIAAAAATITIEREKPAMKGPAVHSQPASNFKDNKNAFTVRATAPGAAVIAADALASTSAAGYDDVRVLGLSEYKAAAATLADAFADDHVAWYFLDTPDRAHWTRQQKWDLHVQILEYVTYAHCLKGLVVTAGPNHDCVALW